jgi:hypothetical protein
MALDAVPDQPQHRRPEAHEERPPFRIAALILADRLRAHPEHDAEEDRGHREAVQVRASDRRALKNL